MFRDFSDFQLPLVRALLTAFSRASRWSLAPPICSVRDGLQVEGGCVRFYADIRIDLRKQHRCFGVRYFRLIMLSVTRNGPWREGPKTTHGKVPGRRITTEVICELRCKLAAGSRPGSAGTSRRIVHIHIFLPVPTLEQIRVKYIIFVRRSEYQSFRIYLESFDFITPSECT